MAPPALLAFPAQPGPSVRGCLAVNAAIPAVRDATGPDGTKRAVLVACPPNPFLLPSPAYYAALDDYTAADQAAAEAAGAEVDGITASAAWALAAAYGTTEPVGIVLVGSDGLPCAEALAALQAAGLVGVQLGLFGGTLYTDRADGWGYDANWLQRVLVDTTATPGDALLQGPYLRQSLFFRFWATTGPLAGGSVALTTWADAEAVEAYGSSACGACWLTDTAAWSWFATWPSLVALARSVAASAQQQARECGQAYLVSQVFNTLTGPSGVPAPLPPCVTQALAQLTAAAAHILVYDATSDAGFILSDGELPVAGRSVAGAGAVLAAARASWLRNVLFPQQQARPPRPLRILPRKVRAVLMSGTDWTRVPLPAGTAFVPGRTLAAGAWDRAGKVFTVYGVLTGPEWRLVPTWAAAWAAVLASAARRTAAAPTGAVLIPETVLLLA